MLNWEMRLSETAKEAKASDIRELLKITTRQNMISLAGGLPDPTLFPLTEYKVAMTRVIERFGAQALQYCPTEGLTELRRKLVEQLEKQGIACPQQEENVLLTTGSQQALELLGRLFINPGDTILVEAPTYVGALQAFNPRKPQFEVVALDSAGIRLDLLEVQLAQLKKQGRQAKFLYTIPTFQNPTGLTLSIERRLALLELAARENLVIIEDDPYGRLRFTGEEMPNLKSLDKEEQVILLQTFSKTLAPALRTGLVVGPPQILQRLAILKQASDLCSSALNQYIIYEMLEEGKMERYIQKVITAYSHKARVMTTALENNFSDFAGVSWNNPQGGMFLWLQLPAGLDSGQLFPEALKAEVAYVKGAVFYPENKAHLGASSLRLNFSQPAPAQIETGITRLADVLRANFSRTTRPISMVS